MTTDDRRRLQKKLQRFYDASVGSDSRAMCLVALTVDELELLARLVNSHITWREWLLPGE